MTEWELSGLVARSLMYIALAGAIGGSVSHFIGQRAAFRDPVIFNYTRISCVIGILASLAFFFIRTGEMLDEGWQGMFDSDVLELVWQGALGNALLLRLTGFIWLLCWLAIADKPANTVIQGLTLAFGWLALCASFTQAGHAVGKDGWHCALLIVHVFIACAWLGSFYPLWRACRTLPYKRVYQVLSTFGEWARLPMLILLGCGLYLSYQLTHWQALTSSLYGQWLLVKIAAVAAILVLAAVHKYRTTARILTLQHTRAFQRSLYWEALFGLVILICTAILTSLMGPGY